MIVDIASLLGRQYLTRLRLPITFLTHTILFEVVYIEAVVYLHVCCFAEWELSVYD